MRTRRAGEALRRLDPRLLFACVPLLFAVPILYALTASLIDVVGSPHPFFGDPSGTSADARAIALGAPLYQDPNLGYTPLTYTPLMSILGGGLDLIVDWDGWPVVLTIAADAALIGLAARLAYGPVGPSRLARASALLGALGMGGIAFWLVGFVPFNSLFAPRTDQLAWAFGLMGLAVLPAAAGGSRRAGIAAVVLVSLGWWTKQPAIAASVAAAVWLTLSAWRGVATWRTWAALVGAIVLVGLSSFGLVHLLTDGWSTIFVVDMPADRAELTSFSRSLHDLWACALPALIVAVAFWLASALGREGPDPLRRRLAGADGFLGAGALGIAGVLVVFVILDAPVAVWFRQAAGVAQNQFIGLVWALGLLAALGWKLAQQAGVRAAGAGAGIVLALFAFSESPGVTGWLHDEADVVVPAKAQQVVFFEEPPALLAYARDHLVYDPGYPGIGAEREADIYPGRDNVASLTWSGRQPGYLVRALLARRFDLVFPFDDVGGTGPWEANYLWKLNQVMKAKYQPSDRLPVGVTESRLVPLQFGLFLNSAPLVRRPGPDPAPWMAHCFGPFDIDGVSWRIAAGGGFWCRPGGRGNVLKLVRTPAPESEIRADEYEATSSGEILVMAAHPGQVTIEVGDRSVQRIVGPGTTLSVPVPAGSHGISIRVGAQTRARVDLGGLSG
jgi:hypothetical protein